MEEKSKGIIIPWMRTLRRGDRPVARPLAVFIQYKSFDRQPNLQPATTLIFVINPHRGKEGV
jgi:hypothetical protein